MALSKSAGNPGREWTHTYPSTPDDANQNAALLIVGMMREFPLANIVIHGTSPVSQIVDAMLSDSAMLRDEHGHVIYTTAKEQS